MQSVAICIPDYSMQETFLVTMLPLTSTYFNP